MIVLGPVRRHQWDERGRLTMPSLLRLLAVIAIICAVVYGGLFALAHFVQPNPREFSVSIPPDNSSRIAEGFPMVRQRLVQRSRDRGTAPTRHTDERLVALYLDMLAAERGAGKNTLAAYGRDLEDFSAYLRSAGRSVAKANTDDLRAYLGELSRRGLRVDDGGATALRDPAALPVSLRGRPTQRRSRRRARRSKRARALPKTLTLAEVDRLLARRRQL